MGGATVLALCLAPALAQGEPSRTPEAPVEVPSGAPRESSAPPATESPAPSPPPSVTPPPSEEPNPEMSRQRLRRLTEPGGYLAVFSTVMVGDGLRFNNPYRLAHELGEGGESLSLTAPYIDVAVVVATGRPAGLVHGGRISWSVAMSGVPQGAITPSYLAALRPSAAWLLYAWAGVPFITAPDFNVGGELAAAATYFVRAGIGASGALVADGFYGAGTRETRAAFYPVFSVQIGLSINYEVLP